MPMITSRAALESEVRRRSIYALLRCTDLMADVLQDSIQANVYNAYEPSTYERRGEDGGLLDRSNYDTDIDEGNLEVKMYNHTPGNFEDADYAPDVATAVESGWTSTWITDAKGKRWGIRPRHIFSPAAQMLEEKSSDIKAIIFDSLRKGV